MCTQPQLTLIADVPFLSEPVDDFELAQLFVGEIFLKSDHIRGGLNGKHLSYELRANTYPFLEFFLETFPEVFSVGCFGDVREDGILLERGHGHRIRLVGGTYGYSSNVENVDHFD